MDYHTVLKLYMTSKRRVADNAQRIAQQKRVVATLKLAGKDFREAENVLQTMQALQTMGEKTCRRLERQANALHAVQQEKKHHLHAVKREDGAA